MSQDTLYKQYFIREYSPDDPDYPGRPFQGAVKRVGPSRCLKIPPMR